MYEKKIAEAREQRCAKPDAVSAILERSSGSSPAVEPAAIKVTPEIVTSTPTPTRIRRRRVRRILLLPFNIAAAVVLIIGVACSGMLLVMVKGGDLSVRKYVDAVQDLPEMIVSKPCNFDHIDGAGCKP